MAGRTLLVELLTEELPPKALAALGDAFAERIVAGLVQSGLAGATAAVTLAATPRRLGVSIADVLDRAGDRTDVRKLMPAKVAYDAAGAPTAALVKRIEKEGVALAALSVRTDGGVDQVWVEQSRPGATLASGLQAALDDAVAKLPIPKRMSYQRGTDDGRETTVQFVRPVHGLVALHGDDVVPVRAFGIDAGRVTAGHRFLGMRHMTLTSADAYATTLRDDGMVVAGFGERRDAIRDALTTAAGTDRVVMPDALLAEVTALVEWPAVYRGTFDERFLDVPQECLILTMQQNQKYFALTDAAGALVNRFLVVSNIATDDPSLIVGGNERVLRARLADAKFFFDQDRKTSLADRVEKLRTVVYHHQLGSQYDRMRRVEALAGRIAEMLDSNVDNAKRAACLAKADLVTDMVGEFPELQGLMGRYYATYDDEKPDVAAAIEEQYRPRFAGDALPGTTTGTCLALAEKLETLAGLFSIGAVPTGDKDPFALRRHALGVVRILIENKISQPLRPLVELAVKAAPTQTDWQPIGRFIIDRAQTYLQGRGCSIQASRGVLDVFGDVFPLYLLVELVTEASVFLKTSEGQSLAEANKRIANLLRQADDTLALPVGQSIAALTSKPDEALFLQSQEQAFWDALRDTGQKSIDLKDNHQLVASLKILADLAEPTAQFFEHVLINAEDPRLRANRIALLQHARVYMNQVADLSRMAA